MLCSANNILVCLLSITVRHFTIAWLTSINKVKMLTITVLWTVVRYSSFVVTYQ